MSGAPRIKIGWWITGVVVLILLFSAGSIITMLTDFCWYKEIGFTSIFFKSLLAKIGCGFIGGIAAVIVLLLNFLLAKNLSKHPFIGAHIRLSQFAQTFAIAPMLGFLIPLARGAAEITLTTLAKLASTASIREIASLSVR